MARTLRRRLLQLGPHPGIPRLHLQSDAAAIGKALMGSKTVRLFHEHVLVKEPGPMCRHPGIRTSPTTAWTAPTRCHCGFPRQRTARKDLEFVAGSTAGAGISGRSDSTSSLSTRMTGSSRCPTSTETGPVPHPRLGAGAGRCGRLQLHDIARCARQHLEGRSAPRFLAPPHRRRCALRTPRGVWSPHRPFAA